VAVQGGRQIQALEGGPQDGQVADDFCAQQAGSEPPAGSCQWTLQLLADELVVLGLVESVSTETVRQALKKTTSSRGSSRRGASCPGPTPSTSGAWRT
jgi:hypothetical protein